MWPRGAGAVSGQGGQTKPKNFVLTTLVFSLRFAHLDLITRVGKDPPAIT